MDYFEFLQTGEDTVDNRSYLTTLIDAYDLLGFDSRKIVQNIKSSVSINTVPEDPFCGELRYIENGLYVLKNIIAYHNIRNLWRKMQADSDSLVSKVAHDLLEVGYSINLIPMDIQYQIPLAIKLRLLLKSLIQGDAFYNYPVNEFKLVNLEVEKLSRRLYFFEKPINGNMQITVNAKTPYKSWAPDVYEYHFDLPYPNLKYFYNFTDMNELNGTYSYIPKSNRMSVDMIKRQICAALYCSKPKNKPYKNSGCLSEFYSLSGIYEHMERDNKIYESEIVKFDLPKDHLVVTDNLGLHRKTQGSSQWRHKRLYYHPLPYPRANKNFFEMA